MDIRRASRADAADYLELVRSLADFERLEPPDEAARARLLAHAFDDPPRHELWLAELEGRCVAYAVTFETYSTFRALPTLYLEDLFVQPEARRRGVARAMMAHLRAEAERRGCGRMEWQVLDWNLGAQAFYAGLGARRLEGWQAWRLDLPDPADGR